MLFPTSLSYLKYFKANSAMEERLTSSLSELFAHGVLSLVGGAMLGSGDASLGAVDLMLLLLSSLRTRCILW